MNGDHKKRHISPYEEGSSCLEKRMMTKTILLLPSKKEKEKSEAANEDLNVSEGGCYCTRRHRKRDGNLQFVDGSEWRH